MAVDGRWRLCSGSAPTWGPGREGRFDGLVRTPLRRTFDTGEGLDVTVGRRVMSDFATSPRFLNALRRFDDENARDPNRERAGAVEWARELLYARRLTDWVLALNPAASEPLRLAARCQHLCRWEIPRDSYPADRPGYLRWRRDLQHFHARRAGEILTAVGYEPDVVGRVQSLNLKQDLGRDPELQVLEDALCLVFLQFQLADLVRRTEEEKVVNALRKSWAKMSEAGRAVAMTLDYGDAERALIRRALEPLPGA